MSDTVLIALLSLFGTLLGSLFGILAANRLTNYRISQLEQTVGKHNKVVERTYILEGQMTECIHDIRDLKDRFRVHSNSLQHRKEE